MKTMTQDKGYKTVARLQAALVEARIKGDKVAVDELEKKLDAIPG